MSKAIEAYENVDEAIKGSNFIFVANEKTYDFEFIEKPKTSTGAFVALKEKISKDWSYKGRVDRPIRFSSEGKDVLFIDLTVPKLWDFIRHDTFAISGFSVSREYEKVKELADYVLELLNEALPILKDGVSC